MIESVVEWLSGLPQEAVVVIVGALPIAELRGALPLALSFGMPMAKAYWLSVLGNLLFIVPALVLFQPLSERLRRFPLWARFFDWLFARTSRNAELIQRYEALGLCLFVAVPLPLTGAWSGVVAASLFKIRFRYAFAAIAGGVLLAGLIVMVLCAVGMMSWRAVAS